MKSNNDKYDNKTKLKEEDKSSEEDQLSKEPKNNEDEIKFNGEDLSENVVTIIIQKIISDIFIEDKMKKINSHYNSHCFKHLKNLLTPYLLTEFIFHENGIENKNKKDNINNEIYFNMIALTKENTWVKINEPKTSTIDRYTPNSNKTKEIQDEIDDFIINDNKNKKNEENLISINNGKNLIRKISMKKLINIPEKIEESNNENINKSGIKLPPEVTNTVKKSRKSSNMSEISNSNQRKESKIINIKENEEKNKK